MTVRDDLDLKLASLRRAANNAHEQGRSPRDVPLTLQDGIEILTALTAVADTLMDAHAGHHHDYYVGGHTKTTGEAQ